MAAWKKSAGNKLADIQGWNEMRSLFLVFCICFSLGSFANEFINGEGRFHAKYDDSLAFIKKQLLYSAFRDVFSKELQSMGLDQELFWRKVDSRFLAYFDPIDEKLRKKYGIDTPRETSSGKDRYQNASRLKRFTLKAKFGRLAKAVTSYSIQKMSRSTQVANSRYLSLQAKVNRKTINKIYLDFTRDKEARQFRSLFISVNFQLEDMTWNDVGVETENDFTTVVKEHWRRWLEGKLGDHVTAVKVVGGEIEGQLYNYLKIPTETTDTLQALATSQAVAEAEGSSINDSLDMAANMHLKDSLWLVVNVKISKKGEDSLLKQRDYEVDGEFILVDLKSNSLATHFDFSKEKKTYSYEDAHKLSSNLASLVYRLPMTEFNNLKSKLINLPSKIGRIQLQVSNVNSIQELFHLNQTLTSKGITYQFAPSISSYSNDRGNLSLSFQGSTAQITELLLSLQNERVGLNKRISFPTRKNPFELVLIDSPIEVKPGEKATEENNEKIQLKFKDL
jgi:hypothetical protein